MMPPPPALSATVLGRTRQDAIISGLKVGLACLLSYSWTPSEKGPPKMEVDTDKMEVNILDQKGFFFQKLDGSELVWFCPAQNRA